jgi:hypothetical protein|nr:MAG TPA: hypothetical protein [Caudoviricetes sp.]
MKNIYQAAREAAQIIEMLLKATIRAEKVDIK